MTDRRRQDRAYSDKTYKCDGCGKVRHLRFIPDNRKICPECWELEGNDHETD